MSERLTLRTPAEIVAAVPDLLGFQPTDSVVALLMAEPTHLLTCTMRADLDTPGKELTEKMLHIAEAAGPGRMVIAIYPDRLVDWIDSSDEVRYQAIFSTLRSSGLEIADVLLVCEGRWWSLVCTDIDCCPAEGRPVLTSTTAVEAQLVHDGRLATAKDRGAVSARYDLRPDLTPPAPLLIRMSHDLSGSLRARCTRALALLSDTPTGQADEVLGRAELMLLLHNVHVRDWVIAALATTAPTMAQVDALVTAALASPPDLRPRVAGAAAAVLVAIGDNPVAVWALLDLAGEDSLAALVRAGVESVIPPVVIRAVFAEAVVTITEMMAAEETDAA